MPGPRETRHERQERTRIELLEAATHVFARRGFEAATLDEIAAHAGYTTGAVYSNFAGKEELFRAAFVHQISRDLAEIRSAQARSADTAGERSRASARTWMTLLRDRPDMFLLTTEQWLRAVRDPEHHEEFAALFRGFLAATTEWVVEEAQRGGYELSMPAEHIALGADALLFGMAMEYYSDPDSVPFDLLEEMVLALLTGLRERSRGA